MVIFFGCLFAKNISLVTLKLSCNCIGDEGVRNMIPGLKQNRAIRNLDLSWNGIRDDGVAWIAEFLKTNNVIKHLNLGYNELSSKGIKCLAEGLTVNASLEVLDLGGNSLHSRDSVVLLEAISKKPVLKLTRLYLNDTTVCPEFRCLFDEVVKKHKQFTVFGMVDAIGQAVELRPRDQTTVLAALDSYIANNKLFRNASFIH